MLPLGTCSNLFTWGPILPYPTPSHSSGGSKGGVRDAWPPGCWNSFNFMQFLGKFGEIVCWHPSLGVGAPSSEKSWIRHCIDQFQPVHLGKRMIGHRLKGLLVYVLLTQVNLFVYKWINKISCSVFYLIGFSFLQVLRIVAVHKCISVGQKVLYQRWVLGNV